MKRTAAIAAACAVLAMGAACSTSENQPPANHATPTPAQKSGTLTVKLGERPFTLHVPDSYDKTKPAPLVILLHGYTASGEKQEAYMKFTAESDKRGFLYATPDGLTDSRGNRFWNATDACCNLYGASVDDSAYVSNIIKTVESSYTVDTKRVYLIGHSNGAFMSFRMACDHADQVTAIAALNGATWADASKCKPSNGVSVLDIRSTDDETINYAGGTILAAKYPSAAVTDADWLSLDQCAKTGTKAAAVDLVSTLPGAETAVTKYTEGCVAGSTVETWTINGGTHVPAFGDSFAPSVIDFLYAQSKQA